MRHYKTPNGPCRKHHRFCSGELSRHRRPGHRLGRAVAFVALVAPQIARRLTNGSGVTLVSAALTGAALVLLSDLVATQAFSPV